MVESSGLQRALVSLLSVCPRRQTKDREVEDETERLHRLQAELRLKITEVEGEVGVVRSRMAAEFDAILKKREAEFASKTNELSASTCVHDLTLLHI